MIRRSRRDRAAANVGPIQDQPIPVWHSREGAGKFWNPELGTFKPAKSLAFVQTGNASLTRMVKPQARYVVLEKGEFGTKPIGFLVSKRLVDEARSKLATRESSDMTRRRAFDRRFDSWQDALPEACEAMFNLNRYAKHATCTEKHRDEIYSLKSDLVRILYQHHHCEACWLHVRKVPAKTCFHCSGTGVDESCGYSTDELSVEPCRRCAGTGIYCHEYEHRFYCFRFSVGEVRYTWHQPDTAMTFSAEPTCPSTDWQEGGQEKPVAMPRHKMAEAKALIRWVVDFVRKSQKE